MIAGIRRRPLDKVRGGNLRECARVFKPGGVLAVVDNIVRGDQDETVREFYRLLDA